MGWIGRHRCGIALVQAGLVRLLHQGSDMADVVDADRHLRRMAGGLLVAILVTWALWWVGSERWQIERLTPEDRAALYERTMANVTLCQEHDEAIGEFCEREVELLASFPQCDADPECRKVVQRWRLPRR